MGRSILVDQHAAHERLTHEAIRTRMLDGGVPGQPLLLPAVVELPEADASRLLARAGDLARLGLEIESFGPGAVLVRALPAALGAPEPAPLIRDIADELAELDETMALVGAARRGDRPHGVSRQHPRRPPAGAGRDGRACCGRWRRRHGRRPAAMGGRRFCDCRRPRSRRCSAAVERDDRRGWGRRLPVAAVLETALVLDLRAVRAHGLRHS